MDFICKIPSWLLVAKCAHEMVGACMLRMPGFIYTQQLWWIFNSVTCGDCSIRGYLYIKLIGGVGGAPWITTEKISIIFGVMA